MRKRAVAAAVCCGLALLLGLLAGCATPTKTAPKTYTYTNNLNYTVKAASNDLAPDFLDRKIAVSGSITKTSPW